MTSKTKNIFTWVLVGLKKHLFLTIAASLGLTATIMAQNVPSYVPTNGLVGWWPFNGNANDSSVNANNGTVTGATLTADRFGNPNNAYSFNGTSANYIDVPHNASFNVSNVTISAWYNALDYGVNTTSWKRLIVSKREWGGWGNSFEMNLTGPFSGTDNKMEACWTINGVNSILTFEDASLLTNTWSHFVYTHDNDSAKIYLNGNLVQSMAISGGLTNNTLPVRFGGRPVDGWHPFNGNLDDIGIWNRALTACEIQDLYSSQLNSSTGINAGNNLTVCQGDQVTLSGSGGSNYNWSGGINNNTPFVPSNSQDYVLTALSTNGCLGIDTVSVTVNQNSTATLNETGLDSVNVNGIWYDQNGQYTQVIPNVAGCDSTITINVSLSFTWLSEISEQPYSIFPNPATSMIQVKANTELLGMSYSIYDNRGKVVLRGQLNAENTSIELGNLSGGIYMLSIDENMKQTFKVIKE